MKNKTLLICVAILFVIFIIGIFILASQYDKYQKKTTYENCDQYNVIPEKYVDKVPKGCLPTYFANLEKLNKQKEQIKVEAKEKQNDSVMRKPE